MAFFLNFQWLEQYNKSWQKTTAAVGSEMPHGFFHPYGRQNDALPIKTTLNVALIIPSNQKLRKSYKRQRLPGLLS
jgi:hypothetical protein